MQLLAIKQSAIKSAMNTLLFTLCVADDVLHVLTAVLEHRSVLCGESVQSGNTCHVICQIDASSWHYNNACHMFKSPSLAASGTSPSESHPSCQYLPPSHVKSALQIQHDLTELAWLFCQW